MCALCTLYPKAVVSIIFHLSFLVEDIICQYAIYTIHMWQDSQPFVWAQIVSPNKYGIWMERDVKLHFQLPLDMKMLSLQNIICVENLLLVLPYMFVMIFFLWLQSNLAQPNCTESYSIWQNGIYSTPLLRTQF